MLQDIQGFKSQRSLRIHPSIRHHTFGLKISLTVKYTNNINKKKGEKTVETCSDTNKLRFKCDGEEREKKRKNIQVLCSYTDKKCEFNPKLSDIEFRQHFEQKKSR